MGLFKKNISIFLFIVSSVFCIVSLIAVYVYDKSDDIPKDISLSVFGVFLSVLIINMLLEKALEKERENLKQKEEEKEEKQWSFINLYLHEKILRNSIAALNIFPPLFNLSLAAKGAGLPVREIEIIDMDKFMILEHFKDQAEERSDYSFYVSRFIHRLDIDQIKTYRTFEMLYGRLKKPDSIFWGELANGNPFASDYRKNKIRDYLNDIGVILRSTEYYLSNAIGEVTLKMAEDKLVNFRPNIFDLQGSSQIKMLGFTNVNLIFSEYEKYGFDLANQLTLFIISKKYYDSYIEFYSTLDDTKKNT